jgi:hypothetical protein
MGERGEGEELGRRPGGSYDSPAEGGKVAAGAEEAAAGVGVEPSPIHSRSETLSHHLASRSAPPM